jgi:fumarylacetoacetase
VTAWVDVPAGHGFGLDALPYGSFSRQGWAGPHVGVAIGDHVLDLTAVSRSLLPEQAGLFADGSLDGLLGAGPQTWDLVRDRVAAWLSDERHRPHVEPALRPAAEVTMLLPFAVADYVDFYASEQHATNLGRMFRPDGDPLTPNWKHLPIGYHGRAGTVVVSGTPVRRPLGQRRTADGAVVLAPTDRLDIEAELGFVVGTPTALGESVDLRDFEQHVFGVCLVNDWSARDIQAWEYVPLGPFLGKSFATSVSPWVLPLAALGAARVSPPRRDVPLLPYLDDAATPAAGFDLTFQVTLNGTLISEPSAKDLYWTGAQMLAHLTVNGASVRTGDLFASGTISSPGPGRQGSLIELSRNGTEPLTLDDGDRRCFLEDGDEVVISATAPGRCGAPISLGEVRGVIVAP